MVFKVGWTLSVDERSEEREEVVALKVKGALGAVPFIRSYKGIYFTIVAGVIFQLLKVITAVITINKPTCYSSYKFRFQFLIRFDWPQMVTLWVLRCLSDFIRKFRQQSCYGFKPWAYSELPTYQQPS